MRGNLSKRDYRHVPMQIAEAWAKGYFTVSLLNHDLIHLTEADVYAKPLCGKTGSTYERYLTQESGSHFLQGRFCKTCVDIAERKRMIEAGQKVRT